MTFFVNFGPTLAWLIPGSRRLGVIRARSVLSVMRARTNSETNNIISIVIHQYNIDMNKKLV